MASLTPFADLANSCKELVSNPSFDEAFGSFKNLPHFLRKQGHGELEQTMLAFNRCAFMISCCSNVDPGLSERKAREIFYKTENRDPARRTSPFGEGLTQGGAVLEQALGALRGILANPSGLDGYENEEVAARWNIYIKDYIKHCEKLKEPVEAIARAAEQAKAESEKADAGKARLEELRRKLGKGTSRQESRDRT